MTLLLAIRKESTKQKIDDSLFSSSLVATGTKRKIAKVYHHLYNGALLNFLHKKKNILETNWDK
jgi:hypothetical protein